MNTYQQFKLLNTIQKVINTIQSCQTSEHLQTCRNYINLYYKNVGDYHKTKIETTYQTQQQLINS